MIITTTLSVEGRTISEYLGIVSAAQVMVMPGGTSDIPVRHIQYLHFH